MGLFDKWFKRAEPAKVEKPNDQQAATKKPRKKKENTPNDLSPKEVATKNGEPYISIVRMNIDPDNVNNGVFELDWNEKFVANLVRAGYQMKPNEEDTVIVDRWFQNVCRNVALEIYEQEQADPIKRSDVRVVQSRDIGNGRTEVS